METHEFFLYLLIILLTARIFAELAWFYSHYGDRLETRS